jgi:hypothetical protein
MLLPVPAAAHAVQWYPAPDVQTCPAACLKTVVRLEWYARQQRILPSLEDEEEAANCRQQSKTRQGSAAQGDHTDCQSRLIRTRSAQVLHGRCYQCTRASGATNDSCKDYHSCRRSGHTQLAP